MKYIHLILLIFLAFSMSSCAIKKNQGSPVHTVDPIVIDTIKSIKATGGSIALELDGTPYTASYGSGFNEIKPMALASLSKPVTAYILIQMEKEGLVSLQDTVDKYVPEIKTLQKSDRIVGKTLFQFMTHNSGLASQPSYSFKNWKYRLNNVLDKPPVNGYVYANDNYTILTMVIINTLGSYQLALDKYINIDGITSFQIGRYHGIPSYAGVGELESSAMDYLQFMKRAAPLSRKVYKDFGIGWFHNWNGYLVHIGTHDMKNSKRHAVAVWNATTASQKKVSFVFQASGVDGDGKIIHKLLSNL